MLAALLANLAIAIAKLIGFLITGAASMLAESVHSLADTGNQSLLLLGGRLAKKPSDEQHPFGYGRERYFWAFVVAMVLFALGSLVALYEGIQKVLHHHEVQSPIVAIGILAIAIVLESLSFRTAIRAARPLKGDMSWPRFIRRTKNPELATVLLEDLGALVGLVLALIGVTVATLTHDGRYDAIGSIAIGVLLAGIAFVLARENKSFLIGEAADSDELAKITSALENSADVKCLIHIRSLHLGPEELLVAAKVQFDPSLPSSAVITSIDSAEARIRAAVPAARMIFIEPDEYKPDSAG